MQVGEQRIVVLGTGGTIAGTAAQAGDNIGYQAAQVGVQQLLEAVPGLLAAAGGHLVAEQVVQIDSKDMGYGTWRDLALRCAACIDDPQVRAVVITHGTDTLEETAWFLQSVLPARKPVVLTCAMRPATALAPDGPQNLLDAVALANTPGAQGVFVVAAGTVHGARHVQKVHSYRVDAFSSGEAGPLGWVEEGSVRWAAERAPAPVDGMLSAIKKIADATAWPRVDIVLNHAGADGAIVDALVRSGTQGIVVAATGNGTMHHALQAALQRAVAGGVQVRVASRCLLGHVLPKPGDPFPDSKGLSPVKARVTLWLELLAAPSASA
ncbi:asparaginase [Paenacidovorax monticola]|uniref:Asparaginase n=1 Tax=Paenacidovorax monticola TaxID=1926868 RepID=A0A7H0HHR9_9BURK|nr:asparaginase [Paenacidovorax monticola]QNP60085.1 asparaginase [Paenacidovorax monticola]